MKKFIYIAILAIITSSTITACTEEPVNPSNNNGTTAPGGRGSNDPA